MKLAEICVRHPVFTVMLIAFLVTLGVFSYRGLAVDLFPKADPATMNVRGAVARGDAGRNGYRHRAAAGGCDFLGQRDR